MEEICQANDESKCLMMDLVLKNKVDGPHEDFEPENRELMLQRRLPSQKNDR